MEESGSPAPAKSRTQLTPEQVQRRQKQADLMLSRRRIAQQLAESDNERYSQLLQKTLDALDAQLAAL